MARYEDKNAIIQVIGNVFNHPELLNIPDKYTITEDDFAEDFYKIIYGSMYKIIELGAKSITLENINDFLESRPKSYGIYKNGKGDEWIQKASIESNIDAFDYYYNRMKKFTLLRMFNNYGVDVKEIYDPDEILNVSKKQRQEEFLDNTSLTEIANSVDMRIAEIRMKYAEGKDGEAFDVGDGIVELIESFEKSPEAGIPLYGDYVNTVHRGARLGKFYLRSAATGVGN